MHKLYYTSGRESDRGTIHVASYQYEYYEMALISAESHKDCNPSAHLTLFTHQNFVSSRATKYFDNIYINIPIHYRAKMWCMARTPYKFTYYLDVDSIIRSSRIKNIFNFLTDDIDAAWGTAIPYQVSDDRWFYIDKQKTITPSLHGGTVVYKGSEVMKEFMQTWFDKYVEQVTEPWKYEEEHNEAWKIFDMFTLWRMTCGQFKEFERFKNLKIIHLPRNFCSSTMDIPEDLGGMRPVVTQYDKISWFNNCNLPYSGVLQQIIGKQDENIRLKVRPVFDPIIEYN